MEVTVRQAHAELQRCSSVLGVSAPVREEASVPVPGVDVDRARVACLSALQDARDTGDDFLAAILQCQL